MGSSQRTAWPEVDRDVPFCMGDCEANGSLHGAGAVFRGSVTALNEQFGFEASRAY